MGASRGRVTSLLSPTELISCCTMANGYYGMGCHGGMNAEAYRYFRDRGLATGGDFESVGTDNTCWPYPFPPFAVHVCGLYNMTPPACGAKCANERYSVAYKD